MAGLLSPRRAALLGLTVPLTPIMIAILGLWPEDDDEVPPVQPVQSGGGGARSAAPTGVKNANLEVALDRWRREANRRLATIIAAVVAEEYA